MSDVSEKMEMDVEAIRDEVVQMDKRLALLEQKVDQIDKNVTKISESLARILWIIGGGFLMAIVAWVIRGGVQ